jgi:ankyrin repeat protein
MITLTSSFVTNIDIDKIGEALFKAVTSKDITVVKKLVEKKGADVNYVRRINSAFFIPVVMQAVMDNSTEIATYLIDKGADVNVKDGFKMTCLMWAANNGNVELVKLLLKKGADKNATDDQGMTALKAAKDKGHNEIVRLLEEN